MSRFFFFFSRVHFALHPHLLHSQSKWLIRRMNQLLKLAYKLSFIHLFLPFYLLQLSSSFEVFKDRVDQKAKNDEKLATNLILALLMVSWFALHVSCFFFFAFSCFFTQFIPFIILNASPVNRVGKQLRLSHSLHHICFLPPLLALLLLASFFIYPPRPFATWRRLAHIFISPITWFFYRSRPPSPMRCFLLFFFRLANVADTLIVCGSSPASSSSFSSILSN